MSELPDNQDEARHDDDSVGENRWHSVHDARSPQPDGGHAGSNGVGLGDEKNPMLTKVADLLDDIVEPDRKMAPSLNEEWQSSLDGQEALSAHDHRDLGKVEVGPVSEKSSPINANYSQDSMGDDGVPEAQNEIIIRGRGDGVAIELGNGDWPRMVANLDGRLEQASSFFRGGQVALDTGSRPLVETELEQVCAIFHKYSLSVGNIRTASERTFQAAMTLGLAATLDSPDSDIRTEATFAASNLGGQTHFVYRGNLRSGHVLNRQESIVIIGDVNPGGHVISSGDILIWGRLRGIAHAGAEGDLNVIVSALMLEPTQLRIANIIAVGPGQSNGQPREKRKSTDSVVPQVAYVSDGKLIIRQWQQARHGFRSVLLGSK